MEIFEVVGIRVRVRRVPHPVIIRGVNTNLAVSNFRLDAVEKYFPMSPAGERAAVRLFKIGKQR